MFKPARMTRVLLGGHKDHLDDVIETLHKEGAVHLEDYEDPTGITSIGTPLHAGDALSGHLVHARGLLKSIGAEGLRGKVMQPNDPDAILAEASAAIHPAMDELTQLRSALAATDAETSALAPFASLDTDLAMLGGVSSIRGVLGTVREDPRPALTAAGIEFEAELDGHAIALAVAASDAAATDKILSNAGFSAANVPPTTGTPAKRLAELATTGSDLLAQIGAAEAAIVALCEEWGPRLAALERHLAQQVEKTQAPLSFAVTETTFHVEGWVPVNKANRLQNALAARYGDSIYFESLGDAPRGHEDHAHSHADGDDHGHDHGHDHGDHDHHEVDAKDEAPVHLENKGLAKPYEFMLGLLGRPRYGELDPTKLMLIFFPLFFGLMVGDLLVGLAIMGVGQLLKTKKIFGIGGPAVGRALVMGGFMAVIVGAFVFGEALGIHFVVDDHALEEGEPSWEMILGLDIPYEDEPHGFLYKTGHAPTADTHALEGGTAAAMLGADPNGSPADPHGGAPDVTTQASHDTGHESADDGHGADDEHSGGILTPHSDVHLSAAGFVNLGYYSKIHDIQALLVWSIIIAVVHLVLGLVLGVRNVAASHGIALAVQEKVSWLIILASVPVVLLAGGNTALLAGGVGALVIGLVLLWIGTAKVLGVGFVSLLEVLGFAGNILSYTRLAAIGASKAGMALAFMAIGFDVIGGGSYHSIAGWIIYLIGMAGITALAMLSGGLQSLRLQFVEFFGKFYTGGGRTYGPFGGRRA